MILSRPIPLPTHGAIKFALAVVVAFGALALSLPLVLAAVLVFLALVLAGLALNAADGHEGGVVRLRDQAQLDFLLGLALVTIGILAVVRGWIAPGAITVASGAVLLWLRARTRYTAR